MLRLNHTNCLFAAVCIVFFATSGGKTDAAESLNVAVDQIAQRIVESRTDTDPSIRIAVNVFAHADGRTSLLSSQLMIALTGRLVELGANKLRVIERAQLESALNELQMSNVPIFDANTAKNLGKFLGVDALVVGEINALTDQVQIFTRMISVETVETMVSSSNWIPLTPTVQKMEQTNVTIARASIGGGDEPDSRNGIWKGTGTCGDLTFGMAVAMVFNPDNSVTAMQTYYPTSPNQTMPSGSLAMEGKFNPNNKTISMAPGNWIFQPPGHAAVGFSGKLDPAKGVINAKYSNKACGAVTLNKQ